MSADTVLPIEVLREIRDAVEKMGARLSERIDSLDKSLGSRIDQTNARLEALDRRVTQGFIETNTKVADLSGRVQQLGENVDKLGARLKTSSSANSARKYGIFASGCSWSRRS